MFEKRHALIRWALNDIIPVPKIGKMSILELWGVLAIPLVILLAL